MLSRGFIETPNLAGGLNAGVHPTLIRENELAELDNFYVFADSIRMRAGSKVISGSDVGNNCKIIAPYFTDTGRFVLITIGDKIRFTDLILGNSSDIPLHYGAAYVNTGKLPFIIPGRNIFYLIDGNGGYMRRGQHLFYEKAGIPAPTVVPTVALNAAGAMSAGDYKVAITFWNVNTGDESDYIESAVVTLGANDSIDVSGIDVSTVPQVTHVNIYVTPVGQVNVYLYAGQVANGVTTFNINKTALELGEAVAENNGPPPDNVVAGAMFDNCLFVTDGTYLYKSKYGQFETFDVETDVQIIGSIDGLDCNLLYAWKNKLIAAKREYIMYYTSSGNGDYIPNVLSSKYGVRSPHAMKHKDDILMWYDGDIFLRSDGGGAPINISIIKIKPYLDNVADTDKDYLIAEIAPRLNSYLVCIPQTVLGVRSTVLLGYNYVENAWYKINTNPNYSFIAEGYDQNEARQLYALTNQAEIVRLFDEEAEYDNEDSASGSEEITYSFLSKGYKAKDESTLRTFLNSFYMLCTTKGITGTLSVYENGSDTPTMTMDAYLYNTEAWKAFELHTIRLSSGADFIQVGFEYTGKYIPDFKITNLGFELVSGFGFKKQFTSIGV